MTNGLRRDVDKKMMDTFDAVARLEGKIEAISCDVKDMKNKVDDLSAFKWRLTGGVTAISIGATYLAKKVGLI